MCLEEKDLSSLHCTAFLMGFPLTALVPIVVEKLATEWNGNMGWKWDSSLCTITIGMIAANAAALL
jgi:hypothetical protein